MLLGQDGEWHPITKTPGLRRFAKNWNSRSRKGPSNAKGTRLVVIPLWCRKQPFAGGEPSGLAELGEAPCPAGEAQHGYGQTRHEQEAAHGEIDFHCQGA